MSPLRDSNIKVAITVKPHQIFASKLCIEGTGSIISGDENLPYCYNGRGKKSLVTKLASRNAGKKM